MTSANGPLLDKLHRQFTLQRHLLTPFALLRFPGGRRRLRLDRLSVLAVRLQPRRGGLALSRIRLAPGAAAASAGAARLLLGWKVVAWNGVAVLIDVLGGGQWRVRRPLRGHSRARGTCT